MSRIEQRPLRALAHDLVGQDGAATTGWVSIRRAVNEETRGEQRCSISIGHPFHAEEQP